VRAYCRAIRNTVVVAVFLLIFSVWSPLTMQLSLFQVGWPTGGSTHANIESAREFNAGLVKHCLSAVGTPAHPNRTLGCYLFELLDEDLKETGPGPFETAWGVFNATVSNR
jgi:exo-beta-1,3-glucanase (GH17 family)